MPVKKVYIAAISKERVETPVVDGGLVTLTQQTDDGVACIAVVDGARRAPQIEVIIDGIDSAGRGKDQGCNQKFISRGSPVPSVPFLLFLSPLPSFPFPLSFPATKLPLKSS